MAALQRPVIVLLGDSITQQASYGWHGLLEDSLQRKVDVLNRGYSGYTTKWIREILPSIFPQEFDTSVPTVKPELVTVFIGANDSVKEGEVQHVPIADFEANLLFIVDWLKVNSQCERILLIAPPPVDESQWDNRSCERVKKYGQSIKSISESTGCGFLDLYEEFMTNASDYASLLNDGLHLNDKGNHMVFESLTKAIEEKYPELYELSMDQSDWKDLAGIADSS